MLVHVDRFLASYSAYASFQYSGQAHAAYGFVDLVLKFYTLFPF
jgi:hypothetical protein